MSVVYDLFGNAGSGGPVDYTTVLATVSGLTWTSPTLANPSSWKFAVRARDSGTGYAEDNVDAVATIVLDASGNNLSARPNPPILVAARAGAGGAAVVHFGYNPAGQGATPTVFGVWITAGSSPGWSGSPAATVAYFRGVGVFAATLSGLTDGATYAVSVRAGVTVSGVTTYEQNTTAYALVVGDSAPPASEVDGLTATAGQIG